MALTGLQTVQLGLPDCGAGIARMRQSPRGESVTEPTFGPSGRQLRLNCWMKKRR